MSEVTNEKLVLSALIKNEEYLRKFLPFIQAEYFEDMSERHMFKLIHEYAGKYNEAPDKSTLLVQARNEQTLSELQSEELLETIKDVVGIVPTNNLEWLKKTTEDWVQQRAVYNALQQSIAIYQGEEKKLTIAAVPDILAKAISVSFESKVGMDYFEDVGARYDFYINPESRVPFRIPTFNEVTCGGPTRKTLNLLVAGCVHPDTEVKIRYRKPSIP